MSDIIFEKVFNQGIFRVYNDKPNIDLIHTHQVHSNIIEKFNGNSLSDKKVDGIHFKLSELSTISFATKTADCMPIILLGKDSAVLLHAGWQGLAKHILAHKLIKSINPDLAFIGPSICATSFEVTSEFKEHFPKSSNFQNKNEKLYFDLQQEAIDQLNHLYSGIQITSSGECTMLKKQYNSYRRDQTAVRNWNVFSLK